MPTDNIDDAMRELMKKYSDFNCGAKVINVIQLRTKRGNGTESDPNRIVTLYRALDGELLAVYDPFIGPEQ